MKVPYVNLPAQHAPIKDQLLAAVSGVIDHGQFIFGEEVTEFERQFAQLCGVSYAVGVNSGTDALILALKAVGVGPGDEVITVSNSFVASASCIQILGARPVFVDVGDDYNLDPTLLEEVVTPKTKAILPVHLTGRPANMTLILEVAKSHGLYVIEDCAQAVGAEHRGQIVGSLGTAGCFSLHPLKTLNACGDGGVITTNDPNLYEQFNILRNHGLRSRDKCVTWSFNSRLDTLQAAILLVKLKYVEQWTYDRREHARFYQTALDGVQGITVPNEESWEKSVYHTFVVQADRRNDLKAYLASKGIETNIHYPVPIHLQEAACDLGYGQGSFPVTERQAERILSLPIYPELEQDQMGYVVECVSNFYNGAKV